MLLTPIEYAALGYDGAENVKECEKAIARAQRMVDLLTDGKCTEYEEKVTYESVLGNLQNAIAAQAEQYLEIGTISPLGKTTVGDFAYSPENDSISTVCPLTMAILKLSGLYYRGVRSA